MPGFCFCCWRSWPESSLLGMLAYPAMLMAGAALGELAVSTAAWTGTAVRRLVSGPTSRHRGWPRLLLGVLLLALVAARVLQLVDDVSDGSLGSRLIGLAWGSVVVALTAGAMAFAVWWADRVSGDFDLRPDPDDVPAAWRRVVPWLALSLGVPVMADQIIGQLAEAVGLASLATAVEAVRAWLGPRPLDVITVMAAGALAVWSARRGLRVAAACAAAFTAVQLASLLATVLDLRADADTMTVLAVPAVLVIAASHLVRASLTVTRMVGLVTVLLLSDAWPYRN
ncbi:hypothetical protein CGZ93_02805 [Enemella dayhoffiae]|uniref:Uncharacterized protein n=1 Tax=Enemella dayhoffiae TaxID=2016507 RepID=A0A255HBE7_9ACTN|nr:hypothetical protein [Enemella dayhoffiae]OYO24646.1 hypothetical protein CGZ93_02805 [Enemella dayhoffiae]